MNINESDTILDAIENFKPNSQPTAEELYKPQYDLYSRAPYWTVSQAACLLGGIAPLDYETFTTLVHLPPILENLIQMPRKNYPDHEAEQYQDFPFYLASILPIRKRTVTLLKAINQILKEALDGKQLKHYRIPGIQTQTRSYLLPEDVVALARTKQIFIPQELEKALLKRAQLVAHQLPKIFPDQICFTAEYYKARIKRNQSLPCSSPCSFDIKHNSFLLTKSRDEGNKEINNEANSTNKSTLSPPDTIRLTQQGEDLLKSVQEKRRHAVDLALQELFPDADERAKHLWLIEKCAITDSQYFSRVHTKRVPKHLFTGHRCKALGKLLRHLNPSISISEMLEDPLMTKYGFYSKCTIKPKTFRTWMNAEDIQDRQKAK